MKSLFRSLLRTFLTEAQLSKGSQRVLANKKMVSDLADAIRDDVRTNPKVFPAGAAKTFPKMPDEQLAKWFLEQLDEIERIGYEGTVYSREGVNNEWIVRRYIAGSHTWEDLIGVMNMNLRDWYALRNRRGPDQQELLEPTHRDLFRFNGVRDVGKYMSTHYQDKLRDVRNAAREAALKKLAKTAKIVDNDDYKIYTVFNWAGARVLGLGTQWCTANSESDTNYKIYSGRAMLFQVYPKNPEYVNKVGAVVQKKAEGTEKYQFDAGTPCFHDLADDPADKEKIKEKFPYLYYDIVKGLKEHKEQIQSTLDELAKDPVIQKDPATRINDYDIDNEIKKLVALKDRGYFTDKRRPQPKPVENPEGSETQPSSSDSNPPENPPEQIGEMFMENIDKDIAAMIQSLKKYDKLVESVAPVLQRRKLEEEPKKDEIPAYKRKESGKDDWKVSKKDLEDKEKDNISSKKGLEDLKSKTGVREETDSDGDVDDMEDSEKLEEKDEGKHNNGTTTGFKAVAKNAAKEYGSKEAGERVAGAVRAKMAAAGKLEETQEPDAEIISWMKRFSKLG
jgi:hypothetical protein